MDVLPIDGKEYVKASKIAREFGYTADYIGQLARANKVDAQLVGRSWYVEIDSLKNHKASRYKKIDVIENEPKIGYGVAVHTTKVTKSAKPVAETTKPVPIVVPEKRFYSRVPTPVGTVAYVPDGTDLIPTVHKPEVEQKTAKINIRLADAQSVSIASEEAERTYTAPKRQKIAFSGDLEVTEIVEADPPVIPPEQETEKPLVATREKTIAIKRAPVSKKRHQTRRDQKNVPTTKGTLAVPVKEQAPQPLSVSFRLLLAATPITAFFIVSVLLGLEQRLSVSESGVEEQLVFRVENLTASVYGFK